MAKALGLRVWGARGSVPHLGDGQDRCGGNTVCLEVLHEGEERIVLDAGTGLANLGDHIMSQGGAGAPIHIFLSHYHWDHVMGLPFFGPIYKKGENIWLYGLRSGQGHLKETIELIFSPAYSPIYSPVNLLGALHVAPPQKRRTIEDLTITTFAFEHLHPGGVMAVKIETPTQALFYTSDVELRDDESVEPLIEACRGCDLLVCNGAFGHGRYLETVGWGHSSLEVAHEVGHRAGVRRVLGIHFDPNRTDDELEEVRANQRGKHGDTRLLLAREGQEVWLP